MSAHSDNPFAPPQADLAGGARPEPGSPIKAVLLGFAVDFVGTNIASALVGAVYGISLAMSGMSPDQLAAAVSQIRPDSWVSIASATMGCGCSFLGGYVCARIAKRAEYRLGLVLAFLSSMVGVILSAGIFSLALHALLVALTVLSVLAGAGLGAAKNRVS